jgi:peptidoglycan/LPS O-acetylase OafA/YrhL
MPGNPIDESKNFGGFGVDIFFVISGFIMWVTTEKGTQSTKEFWSRRITRIVPLYWIFTSVIVLVGILAPWALNSTKVTLPAAVQSYLFIPHYYSNELLKSHVAPLLGPGWTLNYEMFFYFIFGLFLLPPLFRFRLYLISATFFALVTLGHLMPEKGPIAQVYTDQILLEFLLGIFVALSRFKLQELPRWISLSLIVIALASMMVLFSQPSLPRVLVFGLPAALLIAAAVACEPILKMSPSPLFLFLGNASYSLYLSHLFAIAPILFLARKMNISWAVSSCLAVGAAMIVGAITYVFLEKPLTARLNRK